MINEEDIKEYFSDNEWEGMSENEKKMFTDFKITIDIPPHEDIQVKEEPADVDENMEELKIYPDILENAKQEPLEFDENYDSKDKLVETSEYKVSCNEILQKYQSDTIVKSEEGLSKEFQFVKFEPCATVKQSTEDEDTVDAKVDDKPSVNGEKKYGCPMCSYKTNLKFYYTLHLERHGTYAAIVHSDKTLFKCNLCELKFAYQSHVKNHIKEMHKRYRCSECGYETNIVGQMTKHYLTHADLSPYECNICSRRFKKVRYLRFHTLTHTEEKKFHCTYCDYKTFKRSYLQSHVKSQHSEIKRYKCAKCTYQTHTKSAMQRHSTVHDGVRPYVCDLCNKQFKLSQQLERHKYIHTDLKRFHCAHCDYKSNHKSNLVIHIKDKHTRQKQKDYKCSKCKYQTNKSSSLKVHLKTHSVDCEEKLKCAQCGYETHFKDKMRVHVYVHDNMVKPFECQVCQRRFVQKVELQRHVQNNHTLV